MIELILSTGQKVPMKPSPAKKFRGRRLPGAELLEANENGYSISSHRYVTRLFRLSLRNFQSSQELSFTIHESCKYLRLETVLTGELLLKNTDGTETNLSAGQYRITADETHQFTIKPSIGCQYFVVFLSQEMIEQTPLGNTIVPSTPRMMAASALKIIPQMLDNPFEEKFRDAFYDFSVRELLFYHISAPPITLPGELTQAEITAVHAADATIAADLRIHYTIPELARLTQTNSYVLKTGFPRIFGMSIIDRVLQHKMERAKYLLETTDRQIQEISELSGYETPSSFINAFKKLFGISPKDWRKKSRGLM